MLFLLETLGDTLLSKQNNDILYTTSPQQLSESLGGRVQPSELCSLLFGLPNHSVLAVKLD